MITHSERSGLANRLAGKLGELAVPFKGIVFRFVAPKYTPVSEMFAGKGPLFADGRWLAQGKNLVTYTALLPETALAEALASNRYYGFPDAKSAPLAVGMAIANFPLTRESSLSKIL